MKMKTPQWIMASAFFVFAAWGFASMFGQSSLTVSPSGTLASCPAPSSKALIFCNVAGDPANTDGAYVSTNGAAYFLVTKGGAGGGNVATVFGRTGNVLPSQGDYSYSQLSAPPTTLSCSTASHSNTGLTANGCTIK
jgi:hypothetical protein